MNKKEKSEDKLWDALLEDKDSVCTIDSDGKVSAVQENDPRFGRIRGANLQFHNEGNNGKLVQLVPSPTEKKVFVKLHAKHVVDLNTNDVYLVID